MHHKEIHGWLWCDWTVNKAGTRHIEGWSPLWITGDPDYTGKHRSEV